MPGHWSLSACLQSCGLHVDARLALFSTLLLFMINRLSPAQRTFTKLLRARTLLLLVCGFITQIPGMRVQPAAPTPGNPVFAGWYADPKAAIFDHEYWIYPMFSAGYDQQTFFDAFSSSDLVHWTKHSRIVETTAIPWARRAMWVPAVSYNNGKYFFFFAANDIQHDGEVGGLGVAVADHPGGPFRDYLGKPLLDKYCNGAQPIDPFVFTDADN